MKLNVIFKSAMLGLAFLAVSCGDDDDSDTIGSGGDRGTTTVDKTAIVSNYINIVSTAYNKSVASAEIFNTALKKLAEDKDDASLQAAKNAWLAAREDYQPTEAFRFFGPIEEVVPNSDDLGYEVSINAWPLDEAKVLGFIATNTMFNEALFLSNFNEDDNITIGWHPIEFILWGADVDKTDGTVAGNKAIADFTANQYDYLVAAGDILVKYLKVVAAEWDTNGAYRASFSGNVDQALENILLSIGTLANAELGGERTLDPWNNPGEDAEHSCFSDNTNRDNALNWTGVVGVYQGKLVGIEGTSIEDLIKEVNPDLAKKITDQIALVDEIMEVITPLEFEDVIQLDSDKRELIHKTLDKDETTLVSRLTRFGNLLVQAGEALGVEVTVI